MADAERLLHEFIAADRAGGEADPAAYLSRVDAPGRAELEALIDGYLARAPRREFSRPAFEASAARPVAEGLARSLAGDAGAWPALLPRLRDRARLRGDEVVARLAAALGFPEREAKVARYYHAMEQGTLPADGVSDRVLEALGRIVGERAEALRAAGRTLAPPPAPAAAFAEPGPALRRAMRTAAAPQEGPDEVDALFTGGH